MKLYPIHGLGRMAIGLVGVGLLVSACGTSSTGGAKSPKTPIEIGAVVGLTGTTSTNGEYELDAMQLAVKQINAKGGVLGRPLYVDSVDSRSTNEGVVAAIDQLGTSPVALVGPDLSSEIGAVESTIKSEGMPDFIGGTLPSLTHEGNPWMLRNRPTDQYFAAALAQLGVVKDGVKSWDVVHTTDSYGTSAAAYFEAQLKTDGGTLADDIGVTSGTSDFTSAISEIKSSSAKGLVTFITLATDQLRQLGVTSSSMLWIAAQPTISAPSLQLAGSNLNGVYSVSDYVATATPEATTFAADLETTYSLTADVNAAFAYDAVEIIAAAITKAGSTSHSAVRNAVLALKNFSDAQGPVNFNQYGDGDSTVYIVEIENGAPVYQTTVALPVIPYIAVG